MGLLGLVNRRPARRYWGMIGHGVGCDQPPMVSGKIGTGGLWPVPEGHHQRWAHPKTESHGSLVQVNCRHEPEADRQSRGSGYSAPGGGKAGKYLAGKLRDGACPDQMTTGWGEKPGQVLSSLL